MPGIIPVSPKLAFANASGGPLANGTLTVYLAGTTTPSPTWQDQAQTTLNSNPITLDARGECLCWLDSTLTYRFLLKDSGGATIWTVDNIIGCVNLQSQVNTLTAKLARITWVDDYGANTIPGTTDMTAAINAAIAAVDNGGSVIFLNTKYKTSSFVNAENRRGITLVGQKGQIDFGGTQIVGSHTDKAVISLVGSLFCKVESITLLGDTVSRPKTGLLLGRSSAASAGNHTFIDTIISGYYSVAGVYNIASEENTFINPYIVPSAAPLAGVYMCQADGQAGYTIGGLTPSSMECNTFMGGIIGNVDNTAGTTGIYLDCGAATGHHQFYGTFMTKRGGDSFIRIRLGAIDGLNTEFPITFHKVVGEINMAGPTAGLRIQNTGNYILNNLSASLHFNGGTNMILCNGTGTTTLRNADISTAQVNTPLLTSVFQKVEGSRLSLFNETAITIGELVGSDLIFRATPTITTDSGGNTMRSSTGSVMSNSPYSSAIVLNEVAPTYGASVVITATLANRFRIAVTNGTAFTILNPITPRTGQRITIRIINSSGGAMGVITWDTAFKLSAWTNPANGFSRSINFSYNGSNWIEESRTAADIPN